MCGQHRAVCAPLCDDQGMPNSETGDVQFCSSLCNSTLCGGFLCFISPVSPTHREQGGSMFNTVPHPTHGRRREISTVPHPPTGAGRRVLTTVLHPPTGAGRRVLNTVIHPPTGAGEGVLNTVIHPSTGAGREIKDCYTPWGRTGD